MISSIKISVTLIFNNAAVLDAPLYLIYLFEIQEFSFHSIASHKIQCQMYSWNLYWLNLKIKKKNWK
jgi:hypothetical protein